MMSHLAPFVAAALRDKVVAELQEDNEELKKRLMDSQRYEIVSSPMNKTLHAEGLLQDAEVIHFGAYLRVPFLQTSPCLVQNMEKLVVMVGGHCLATFFSFLFGNNFSHHDKDTENSKYFEIRGMNFQTLCFTIQGWPRHSWSQLVGSRNLLGHNFHGHLKMVATEYPDATFTFHSIILRTGTESGALFNLPEPARTRLMTAIEEAKAQQKE